MPVLTYIDNVCALTKKSPKPQKILKKVLQSTLKYSKI